MALPYVSRAFVSQLHQRGTQLIHQRCFAIRSTSLSARLSNCCEGHVQLQRSVAPLRIFSRHFRTKRRSITQIEEVPSKSPPSDSGSLFQPFLYTVGLCGCSFAGAMILSYEKMRSTFQSIKNKEDSSSDPLKKKTPKAFGIREHINGMWTSLNNGEKVILGIVATNLAVLALWKVPRLQSTMVRYFSSSLSHPLPSMTLSSFSHISFLHMFINMYVLWSFTPVAVKTYGYEQFSAIYVSAGTFASFASIAMNKLLRRPPSISVGASGAIMALLGIVCVTYPNAQLSVALISAIFPHSFSADSGMKVLIAFDLLGLIMGWRVIDHAGHLGGMLFGILYAKYGQSLIWGNRESIMKVWHDLRGKP